MCVDVVHSPLSFSSLSVCLSLFLNRSSHVEHEVLERERTEQTSVHCCFPFSNELSHHSLRLLILCFSCVASILLIMKLLRHTDTHLRTHTAAGTAVQFLLWSPKSSVLCSSPLNNYFYDLLPNDSCWLHNQAKHTAAHIWI